MQKQADAAALRTASDWRIRQETGLSAAEQAELNAWLMADPNHRQAWHHASEVSELIERLRPDAAATAGLVLELSRRRQQRKWRRRVRAILAATTAAAAAVWVLSLATRVPAPVSTESEAKWTEAANSKAGILRKAERRKLEDGSEVDLRANASIRIAYTPARREVELLDGEALFKVKKNTVRPFIVRTGSVEVRAVGTAFSVLRTGDEINVLVTEGEVAVTQIPRAGGAGSPAAASTPVLVGSGKMLVVPATGPATAVSAPEAIARAEIERRLWWVRPRLALDDTALADAVAMLNSENGTQIVLGDAALGQLRLTGSFMADDPAGFAQVLANNYDLAIERPQNDRIILQRPAAPRGATP